MIITLKIKIENDFVRELLDWTIHITLAIIIGFFIVNFVVQITIVHGDSMEITLQNDDRILVEKISSRFNKIKHGDIVTVNAADKVGVYRSPLIKRVIGLENDHIEIYDGKLFVNGLELSEDYINGTYTDDIDGEYSDFIVPEGEVYVVGDNREPGASLDSRKIGPVEIDKIDGRAFFRIFPFKKIGLLR